MCECVNVWVCVPGPEDTSVCLCACVACACFVCVLVDGRLCERMTVCECVPVGACSDLGIDSQLLHLRVRHEGEKGGNDCCVDLCLICCVLSRLSTGMHAADLQNLLIVLPIYPVILVYSTIRVLF